MEQTAAAADGPQQQTLDVLGDGRLVKTVLSHAEGDASVPQKGDKAVIHYVCRVANVNGEVVDSSRERSTPFVFFLGRGEVLSGLDLAVSSMKQGERALFSMHPELAYGAAGCGGNVVPASPPASTEAATLHWELELLEVNSTRFGDTLEDENLAELSPEERLETAMRCKDSGNSLFKAESFQQALDAHRFALRALGLGEDAGNDEAAAAAERHQWGTDLRREARAKLALACHLNAAQCCLRLELHKEAFKHAGAAVNLDSNSTKALYRRGLAAMGMGSLDRARADLTEVAKREPRNAEVRVQLEACKKEAQNQGQKERSTLGGMFDRAKR